MDEPVFLQVVLVGMMVVVSVVGFSVVPREHRFRMRFGGFSGPEGTVGKTTGLITYPALGAIIAAGTALAGDDVGAELGLLGVAGIGLLLLVQVWAVRSAR